MNKKPLPLLPSVPPYIASIASNQVHIDIHAGGDSVLLQRLITYPEMAYVWTEIGKFENHSDVAHSFFVKTSMVRVRWLKLSHTPKSHLEENIRTISDTANKLANQLDAFSRDLELAVTDVPTLTNLIEQHIETTSGLPDEERGHLLDLIWDANFYQDRPDPYLPTLPEVLRLLAERLKLPFGTHEYGLRPTKVRAITAERTYAVRVLSDFFLTLCQSPRFDLVAPTVTTLLDLADDPLTIEHAQKLV
jgi:hypothetical protein